MEHLEEQAKNDKEREDYVPYKKEKRGKVWRPKDQPGRKEPEPMLPDDLSEVLDNATDEEMMELAGNLSLLVMVKCKISNKVLFSIGFGINSPKGRNYMYQVASASRWPLLLGLLKYAINPF